VTSPPTADSSTGTSIADGSLPDPRSGFRHRRRLTCRRRAAMQTSVVDRRVRGELRLSRSRRGCRSETRPSRSDRARRQVRVALAGTAGPGGGPDWWCAGSARLTRRHARRWGAPDGAADIADTYRVSEQMAAFRLRATGVLRQRGLQMRSRRDGGVTSSSQRIIKITASERTSSKLRPTRDTQDREICEKAQFRRPNRRLRRQGLEPRTRGLRGTDRPPRAPGLHRLRRSCPECTECMCDGHSFHETFHAAGACRLRPVSAFVGVIPSAC
jgi:hypothetical protein